MQTKLVREVIYVNNMTYVGDEEKLENALMKIAGVLEAKAVKYDGKIYIAYDAGFASIGGIQAKLKDFGCILINQQDVFDRIKKMDNDLKVTIGNAILVAATLSLIAAFLVVRYV